MYINGFAINLLALPGSYPQEALSNLLAFKRWVDKNASEDEASLSSMAPPSDFELSRNNSTANFIPNNNDDNNKDKIPLNNNTLAPPAGNK